MDSDCIISSRVTQEKKSGYRRILRFQVQTKLSDFDSFLK